METAHIAAVAAIPTTLLVVSQAVQGTAQSIDAIDDYHGDDARNRIRTMSYVAGGALIIAALAASIRTNDLSPFVATFVTACIVIFAFNRVTL